VAVVDVSGPTLYQQTGLSISYFDPLWASAYQGTFTDQINTYRHELRAVGGYWSAQIRINDSQTRIEEWIENGIGRHVEVNDDAMQIVWEGFVNRITANLGEVQFEIGPMTDIGNRVKVVYSTFESGVDPPVNQNRAVTAVANDTDSQALYGIIEKILSTGGSTATQAEQNRDTWLTENAWPPTSLSVSLGRGRSPTMSLDCLGYWHLLGLYSYENTGVTGEENLSTKIQNILGADPNSVFSTDYSRITTNTLQVEQYADGTKTAEELLKSLNALGDSSDNRYNMGIYQGQRMIYEAAPTDYAYKKRITANEDFTDPIGGVVKPWNVQAGKWFFVPDFMIGREPPVVRVNLNRDPRAGFIETVRFRVPREVKVNGEKLSRLDQALAKQGLAGIGA